MNTMELIEKEVELFAGQVVGVVYSAEIARSRSGGKEYWEKTYIVAWQTERECGTHQANVNSEGKCALFHANFSYGWSPRDAIGDMLERANLSAGRI